MLVCTYCIKCIVAFYHLPALRGDRQIKQKRGAGLRINVKQIFWSPVAIALRRTQWKIWWCWWSRRNTKWNVKARYTVYMFVFHYAGRQTRCIALRRLQECMCVCMSDNLSIALMDYLSMTALPLAGQPRWDTRASIVYQIWLVDRWCIQSQMIAIRR